MKKYIKIHPIEYFRYYLAKQMESWLDYFTICLIEFPLYFVFTSILFAFMEQVGLIDFEGKIENILNSYIIFLSIIYFLQTAYIAQYRRSIKYPIKLMTEMISDNYLKKQKNNGQIDPASFLYLITWQLKSLIRIINEKTSGYAEELIWIRIKRESDNYPLFDEIEQFRYAIELNLIDSIEDFSENLIRKPFFDYGQEFLDNFKEIEPNVNDLIQYVSKKYQQTSPEVLAIAMETEDGRTDIWSDVWKPVITTVIAAIVLWIIKYVFNINI